jgi:hypothetical protein
MNGQTTRPKKANYSNYNSHNTPLGLLGSIGDMIWARQ